MSTSAPRLLTVLGARTSAVLVEEFAGAGEAGAYFCNAVAEVVLGEDARLMHGCGPEPPRAVPCIRRSEQSGSPLI